MRVAELMSKSPSTIRADDSLARAVMLMQDRDCGCVVVVDAAARPIGVLTDRDVCLGALRAGRALAAIPVALAMSNRLYTCRPDEELTAAEATMALHQVRRLPVVDAEGRTVGVVSLDDIARRARQSADLFAPPVTAGEVGRTLGDISRPHLIGPGS